MDDQVKILQSVSNAVTQEPIEISVDIEPQNWLHAKLQQIKRLQKFFPVKKKILIHPVKMGTLIKISNLLLTIGDDDLEKIKSAQGLGRISLAHSLISKHAKTLIHVVAHAIHNKKTNPSDSLITLIRDQFTPEELVTVLIVVLKQMDTQNFFASIISVRGMDILMVQDASAKNAESSEVNPQTKESQIAPHPGTLSEGLQSIFDGAKTSSFGGHPGRT